MKPIPFFAALCGLVLLAGCTGKNGPVLTVEGGELTGLRGETSGVMVYKGIPYAAPPVGNLRWREPQPVVAWKGIRRADAFAAAAVQEDQNPGAFYQKEFHRGGNPVRREDCLYLNVWTPAAGKPDARLPVAVWIHGGDFTRGFGHEPEFDGEAYAARGVILVTFNYRLGVFGFLAHPLLTAESSEHTSGNYGLLDQRAALAWVRRNIAQFGGDPDRITVMGQDAGAESLQQLLLASESRQMISKAIMQSAAGLRKPGNFEYTLASAEENGVRLMKFAGLTSLDSMRAADAGKLCSLAAKYRLKMQPPIRFAPNIDGVVVTESFSSAARGGKLPDVPCILGYTNGDTESLKQSVDSLAMLLDAQGMRPAYVYEFNRPLPGDRAGAFRSGELWYEFGTLDRSWRPFTDADRALSARMIGYWTRFIGTGDPNGDELILWKPFTQANPRVCDLNIDLNLKQ